jgi:translation initiation factor 1 (eIF-1/SUI1)
LTTTVHALNRRPPSQVVIERVDRGKRKFVTTVLGLEHFGVDLKKAAKLMASKFATGASVTKNPQGLDDITIQGDVSDEVVRTLVTLPRQGRVTDHSLRFIQSDMLTSPSKKEKDICGGGIPESSIEQIIKKKKEKPPPGTVTGAFVL